MSDSPEIPPVPNTPPPSPGPGQPSNNVLMLILSYLWLLALIPLLVEKNDREVQWHAKHGLVLLVAEFVIYIGIFILSLILAFIPFLGCGLWGLFSMGALVLHIICIIKATKGERLIIPQLSVYADRF